MGPRYLVLWDIDGTLVDTHGVSQAAVADAFARVTGEPLRWVPEVAGRTDRQIIATALANQRVAGSRLACDRAFFDRYSDALAAAIRAREDELRTRGRALDGAREVLAALHGLDGVVQTVATGNIRRNAQFKLSTFGLDAPIDFEVGGYGCRDGSRGALVGLACERAAAKYATTFPPARTVVVGDTPYDIDAAKANRVRAVGVTTGRNTAAELYAAGADAVIESLRDTDTVVRTLLDA